MTTINKKLKDARLKLGFSQDYVANVLGLGRSSITQIELGNRKVTTDELAGFCKLYHLSADVLLDNNLSLKTQTIYARGFEDLTENDQQEILNLIAFKKAMTAK